MSTTASSGAPAKAKQRPGDAIFSGLSTISGVLIFVILAAVAAFLLYQAVPALQACLLYTSDAADE